MSKNAWTGDGPVEGENPQHVRKVKYPSRADCDPVKPPSVGGMQFAEGDGEESTYTLVTHKFISPEERHLSVASMNFSRWAPGHDQIEPREFRSVFGFDIVFGLDGSVYPGIAPRLVVSCLILCAVKLVRWLEPEGYNDLQLNYFDHPYVFQVFTYVLGFVLVFRINLTYGRWWSGRMMLEGMSSKWFDAAQQACCFDQFTDTTEQEKQLFRMQITGLTSVLHAVAVAELGGTGAQVPCLMDQLVTPSGERPDAWLDNVLSSHEIEPVFQVVNWLTMCVTDRFLVGGWPIPSPILSRIYQELSNGMLSFHKCAAIKVTPFPFPFNQMVELALGAYNVTLPLCIDRYAEHWYWAILFLVLAEFAVFGLAEVAKELEQPFGDDYNDLPLLQYHVCFDLGLRSFLNRISYSVPNPNLEALDRVYKIGPNPEARILRHVKATPTPRRAWYSRPLARPEEATANFKTTEQILHPEDFPAEDRSAPSSPATPAAKAEKEKSRAAKAEKAKRKSAAETQPQRKSVSVAPVFPVDTKRKSVVGHLQNSGKARIKRAATAPSFRPDAPAADSGSDSEPDDRAQYASGGGALDQLKLGGGRLAERRRSSDKGIVELRRTSKESVHGLDGKDSPRSPGPPEALPSP